MTEEIIRLEKEHLSFTVRHANTESGIADADLISAKKDLDEAMTFHKEGIPVAQLKYDNALRHADNMKRAIAKPYFTRIDFA